MAARVVVFSCLFGCLVSSIYGQCLPVRPSNCGVYSTGLVYSECPLAAAAALEAAHGGGFAVTSASPLPPHGVSVLSENEYSGILPVVGQLPFLGTTQLEGAVPSAGAGVVTYGCGYGDVAIRSEDFAGTVSGLGYGSVSGLGYGSVSGLGYSDSLISVGGFNGLRGCGVYN